MKRLFILLFNITLICLFSFSNNLKTGGDSDYRESDGARYIPAMIMIDDDDIEAVKEHLTAQGVIILRQRANILLTYIPAQSSQPANTRKKFSKRGPGYRVEYSKPRINQPQMREAKLFNNANYINEGKDLPQPYDGKGVVIGVCDIGMDTRHPNFLNADGTECRIRKVVHYQEEQGLRTEYNTPEEIYDWQTDDADEYHATHVTGIAAGAHKESGYHSLAPEADIVFTASQLSDVGLLAGVEDIIEYAKSVNKPAVINLSMGNPVGPKDGTSLFTRYLDLCAEDAIICISAGNDGNGAVSMSYDFTDSKRELRVRPNDWDGMEVSGYAEVWSKDATPFDFNFYYSSSTRYADRIDAYEPFRAEDGQIKEWSISLDPSAPDYDETFDRLYVDGYVVAEAGISPLNGRYYAAIMFDLVTDIYHADTKWAEYWPAIRIEAEPGTHVDISCGGGSFLRGETGFPQPDNKLNISDLATGRNTISVGMMNNTDIDSSMQPGSGWLKGDACIYSSYGTLIDGRKLPLTVAPGAWVISSCSSPYIENHPEKLKDTDSSDYEGSQVYWIGDLGTSMSCPFVVSTIATWLQAYPQLLPEEAVSIILKTNQTGDFPNINDPRHGQGWIKPYSGMQEVLKLAALHVGTVDCPEVTFKVSNGQLIYGNPTGNDFEIAIYNISGLAIKKVRLSGLTGNFSLTDLPSGIYLIRSGNNTMKIRI